MRPHVMLRCFLIPAHSPTFFLYTFFLIVLRCYTSAAFYLPATHHPQDPHRYYHTLRTFISLCCKVLAFRSQEKKVRGSLTIKEPEVSFEQGRTAAVGDAAAASSTAGMMVRLAGSARRVERAASRRRGQGGQLASGGRTNAVVAALSTTV